MNNNKSLKVKFSWALYDWANSAWGTVITTFVFATYFTEVIALNKHDKKYAQANTKKTKIPFLVDKIYLSII